MITPTILEIQGVVDEIFPDLTYDEKLLIRHDLVTVIESKDLGRFTGAISVFKQQAIDTAAGMKKPVISRRGLEKDAAKKLDKLVNELTKDMERLRRQFRGETDRKISKTKFRKEMEAALRIAYTDAYRLGTRASGLVRATDLSFHLGADEKKWLNKVFFSERKLFAKFLDAILKGESASKSRNRIRNYANAVRSVFDSSRVLQLPDNVVIHWVLQSRNPCPDCRLLHRLSPYVKDTLPTTPKSGSTRCLSFCHCKFRIVNGKPAEIRRIRSKNKSAKHLLKRLEANRKKGRKSA